MLRKNKRGRYKNEHRKAKTKFYSRMAACPRAAQALGLARPMATDMDTSGPHRLLAHSSVRGRVSTQFPRAMALRSYREVPLEGLGPSVGVVPTNLTVVVDIQAMKLIQPIGDGLKETNNCMSSPSSVLPHGRDRGDQGLTLPSQPRGRFLGL